MHTTGSAELTEITVIILSIIILCMSCVENDTQRCHGIIIASLITFGTAVLETIRDFYIAVWFDKDGYGCSFV